MLVGLQDAFPLTPRQEIRGAIKEVRELTTKIIDSPYKPEHWYRRAQFLLLLGYPELAVGDAYKAHLLFEAWQGSNHDLEKNVALAHTIRYWSQTKDHAARFDGRPTAAVLEPNVQDTTRELEFAIWATLLDALAAAHCSWDCVQICKNLPKFDCFHDHQLRTFNDALRQRARLTPTDPEIDTHEPSEVVRNGVVLTRAYPWFSPSMLHRSDALVQGMKQEIVAMTSICQLASSSLQTGGSISSQGISSNDCLGVFASKDIVAGEHLLTDSSIAFATTVPGRCTACCGPLPSKPVALPCCNDSYCDTLCASAAASSYHPLLCGKDLSSSTLLPAILYPLNGPAAQDFSFQTRVLALILASNSPHPLQSPLIAPLVPQYNSVHPLAINLATIAGPIHILTALGIDVFANPSYDTWVLQTIHARLANNVRGEIIDGGKIKGLNSIHCLFNHSCAPNVTYEGSEEGGKVVLRTKRAVRKGEELCVTYIEELQLGERERGRLLGRWLGSGCGCERCVAERAGKEPGEYGEEGGKDRGG